MGESANDPEPAATGPSAPVDGWIAPSAGPRSRLEKIALLIAVVAILSLVLAFAVGFVSAFFADRNAPPALASMIGPLYDELPADFRAGIDARLRAVAPAGWDQWTEAQRSGWAKEQVDEGLVRLDDATLVRLLRLGLAAEQRVPVAVCAAFLREGGGSQVSRATDEAFNSAISPDERMERIEIHLEAIEAQVRGTPAQRTVSETDADRVNAAVEASLTPEERALVEAYLDGPSPSDAETCAADRAVIAATLRLPAGDLATNARWSYRPDD